MPGTSGGSGGTPLIPGHFIDGQIFHDGPLARRRSALLFEEQRLAPESTHEFESTRDPALGRLEVFADPLTKVPDRRTGRSNPACRRWKAVRSPVNRA